MQKPLLIFLPLLMMCSFPVFGDTIKVVDPSGKGDYKSVVEALSDVPLSGREPSQGKWIIKIKPGEYYGYHIVSKGKDNVVLAGEDPETTILWYDDYAGSGKNPREVTLLVEADDFTAVGLTIKNPFQNQRETPGENSHTQATAVMTIGDRAAFYNCSIVGNQDTFWGRSHGRVYVKDCYVEGNVDYIYGASVMVFEDCTIYSNQHDSYITAASTDADSKFGITFLNCRLEAKEQGEFDHDGVQFQNFYLGRPWHNSPHVAFIRCYYPKSVYAEGWTYMNPGVTPKVFGEYKCYGPGAESHRLKCRELGRQLTRKEAKAYTVKNIFSKETFREFKEDWLPAEHYNEQ